MKKQYIILHWTAGNYLPNSTDLTHYQMLIDGTGNKIVGKENLLYFKSLIQGLPYMNRKWDIITQQ